VTLTTFKLHDFGTLIWWTPRLCWSVSCHCREDGWRMHRQCRL